MQLFLGDSMRRENILNGCPTSGDDRTKILVAVEPRTYRMAIGGAIQTLRPHLEVTVVEPEELRAEVARLGPALVISSQPKPATSDGGPAWMEYHPYYRASARVCIGHRCVRINEPGLGDLLSVVDEAERFGRTPPEQPGACILRKWGEDRLCEPGIAAGTQFC
jgi:hypothetical protein